jgi:hypothetical protein
MQRLARQLWEQRARTMGLDLEAFGVSEKRNTPPV